MAWEAEHFDLMVADLFGYHAVQVGLGGVDLLRNNRIPVRVRCDSGGSRDVRMLLAEPEVLPFEANSVDLLLLPHVLEFAALPHQVLREVERVLVPEGRVIVSGFNPLSLWGVRRFAQRRNKHYPWEGQYLSVRRLKDWLKLLSFDVHGAHFGCYAPPLGQDKWLARCRFMDRIGKRWWPVCGGVYVLQAVKRVHGMRLIQPKWRTRAVRAKSLSTVAQKGPRVVNGFRKIDEQ